MRESGGSTGQGMEKKNGEKRERRSRGMPDKCRICLLQQNGLSAILEPALLDGIANEIGSTLEPQLFHRPGTVGFDRLGAQFELRSDFLVAVARCGQSAHFQLSVAEFGAAGVAIRNTAANEAAHHLPRHRRVEVDAALRDDADGVNELGGRGRLEYIPGCARRQKLADVTLIFVNR